MYYVLRRPPLVNDNGEAIMEIHNSTRVGDVWSWRSGRKLDDDEVGSIPEVVEIEFDVYRKYDGPPVEIRDIGVPIMSERLMKAMVEFGVNNIEFFPAILKNKKTKQKYDYFLYNIVGLISAADMENSEYASYDDKLVGDVSFNKLAVDESAAKGVPIFRLAENFSALMVHERLKNYIEGKGIDTLVFLKPEEWVHL